MKKIFTSIVLALYILMIIVGMMTFSDEKIIVQIVFEIISFVILAGFMFGIALKNHVPIQYKASMVVITIIYLVISDILNIGNYQISDNTLIFLNVLFVFLYFLIMLPIYYFSEKYNKNN